MTLHISLWGLLLRVTCVMMTCLRGTQQLLLIWALLQHSDPLKIISKIRIGCGFIMGHVAMWPGVTVLVAIWYAQACACCDWYCNISMSFYTWITLRHSFWERLILWFSLLPSLEIFCSLESLFNNLLIPILIVSGQFHHKC